MHETMKIKFMSLKFIWSLFYHS